MMYNNKEYIVDKSIKELVDDVSNKEEIESV